MRVAGVALTLVACGRVHFDARLLPDAELPPGAFGTASPVDSLNSSFGDGDPALTGDQLEMYFDSARPGLGAEDIYRTVRERTDQPWSAPTLVTELSTAASDVSPGITPDGLTLYFATDVGAGRDIYVTTRPDRTSQWGPPVRVDVSATGEDSNPQPSADGLELWFCSRRGGTVRQLYLSTRATTSAAWSAPILVDLNVSPDIYTCDPWPSPDGMLLYFASDRPGTLGGTGLWRAPRIGETSFGVAEPITELDSAMPEHDPWLSPDQRTIYFMRASGGNGHLFVAER